MKFPLLSEFFHQAELGSEKQVAQKIFWLQHWSVQLMKSSSVGPRFHSSRLWFTLKSERSERGAARQLHNLLQIYILKFSLSLTWWHRSKRSSFKSDERQETALFLFIWLPLTSNQCHTVKQYECQSYLGLCTHCTNLIMYIHGRGFCLSVHLKMCLCACVTELYQKAEHFLLDITVIKQD